MRTIKCLTLTQPWATLMTTPHPDTGEPVKLFETRSWSAGYRGPLAIHAAKGFPKWAREQCAQEPFASVLDALGYPENVITPQPGQKGYNWRNLPLGKVLGVVQLEQIRPTYHREISKYLDQHPLEEAFGDYTPGRFAWMTYGMVPVAEPFDAPVGGFHQGLWTLEYDETVHGVLEPYQYQSVVEVMDATNISRDVA